MLNNNNYNYLIEETIILIVCKRISSNSFKNEIADKLISVYQFKCVQTNDWC